MADATPPCILGPNGQPVSSAAYDYGRGYGYGGRGRFLEAADQGGGKRDYWRTDPDSINRLVPPSEFRATVAISDKLIANTDVIKGALRSKADFCVGDALLPTFLGAEKSWGTDAEKWLRESFYPISNLDGDAMSDLRTDMTVGSVRIDAAGSFGVMLSEYEGGFPAVQYIPTWRLFNGDAAGIVTKLKTDKNPAGEYLNDANEVQDFTLTGQLLIFNGIIYNPVGMRRLYYRIRLENTDSPLILSSEYIDVHASDFIYAYEREFHDGLVGWPTLSASVGKLRDALQSHEWEQLSMLAHSAIIFTEDNETGGPDANDPRQLALQASLKAAGLPPINGGMQTQELLGGLIRYFKANSGGKLSSFGSQRPGDSWENIQDRIYDAGLRGAGWPLMGWTRENPGGQMARAAQGTCRATITRRQRVLRKVVNRINGYAASKAIKIKALKPYPGTDIGGALKWDVTLPALMSIDDGRDSDNRRKDYDKGFRNVDDILADLGAGDEESHWERRARSVSMRKRAAALENQKPENVALKVTVDSRDMMMATPNEQPDGEDGAGDAKIDPDDEPPVAPPKKDPTTP